MYLPPVGTAGKLYLDGERSARFEVKSSGIWRLAVAFGLILALALTADLAFHGSGVEPATVTAATGG